MGCLEVKSDPLAEPVQIYYEDEGTGFPVVLIHGWPFTHAMWRGQREFLVRNGCRVISYDRRGFGQSGKPDDGYHYHHFAQDLNALLETLDLNHVTLVGYSMGAGDVVRYMLQYFGQRVSQIALISGITPSLAHSDHNPNGVSPEVFQNLLEGLEHEPGQCLQQFFNQAFDDYARRILRYDDDWAKSLSVRASPHALRECVKAFAETDFIDDMRAVADVPTLVVHGDADPIAPIQATGKRAAKMLHRGVFKVYDHASHGLFVTHAEQLNEDILNLVKDPPSVTLPLEI